MVIVMADLVGCRGIPVQEEMRQTPGVALEISANPSNTRVFSLHTRNAMSAFMCIALHSSASVRGIAMQVIAKPMGKLTLGPPISSPTAPNGRGRSPGAAANGGDKPEFGGT